MPRARKSSRRRHAVDMGLNDGLFIKLPTLGLMLRVDVAGLCGVAVLHWASRLITLLYHCNALSVSMVHRHEGSKLGCCMSVSLMITRCTVTP